MAHHGSSSLTRTRPARAPTTSRAPSSASSSSAVTAAQVPTATPTAVPNVSLFLTNLRLLDLDLHPDWPDISAATFGTRDAAQGQKKRIQCVEWALYHLFTLWDPDEARDKLQPFFPPLDQVQSINLRAALLRSLEHAKKNGALGRDAVVRKTMLDECKGERLEEVLAVFSSAVLKKLVAEQQLNERRHPSLAQTLALENRGYSGERTELITLALAYRASLRQGLDRKNAARARYNEFTELMELKERNIMRRKAQVETLQEQAKGKRDVSEDSKLDVWRTVRNNWSGNERWMEALLYGDSHARKDGVLSTPFDRVWRRVEAGRLADLESKSAGLLEQLDGRVKSQKERLERWQGFRQRLLGKSSTRLDTEKPRPTQKQKGVDLGFRVHETLHLGRMSPRKLPRNKPREIQEEYDELIRSLKTELADLSPRARQIPLFFQRPLGTETGDPSTANPEPEAISDISDLEDDPAPSQPLPTHREPVKTLEPVLRRTKTLLHHSFENDNHEEPRPLRRSATVQSRNSAFTSRRTPSLSPTRSPDKVPSPPMVQPSPQKSPTLSTRSPPRVIPISPERTPSPERPISPTQQLADQILASVNAASPSPMKKPRHTLSLAERTRLSMARRSSHTLNKSYLEDEDDLHELQSERLAAQRTPTVSIEPAEPTDGDGDGGYEDLVARTRRSMAGFEAAQKKAQLERRRSLRKSKQVQPSRTSGYFPAVDEEEQNTTLLLAEELMSGDVDQDAVFMSRPKIKTSPVGTPIKTSWMIDD
ncbi:HAUS augmin-like complex subunit 6 N-terminus-domain-containing protein [Echria macrotheca]|uniref:HAUS augmin-like complex subunit 6 N-terminus-domain-containing protein n=1 Tax=Echria macrotheca TaxID=438768 RepID=A0AAJ0B634_9PEZI|nr:HAUS augmin-like complex subunit 6 N-terminus-domain-containing protein [Echria macrotheca]